MDAAEQPIFHAPKEIETERFVLKRSVDARDKPTIIDHVKEGGKEEFIRWSGLVVPDITSSYVGREFEDFSLEGDDKSWAISYTVFTKDRDEMAGYVSLCEAEDTAGLLAYMGLLVDPVFTEADWYLFGEAEDTFCAVEAVAAVLGSYFKGSVVDDPRPVVYALIGDRDFQNVAVAKTLGFKDPLLSFWPDDDAEEDDDDDDSVGSHRAYRVDVEDFMATYLA